jgi:hypothetical protein
MPSQPNPTATPPINVSHSQWRTPATTAVLIALLALVLAYNAHAGTYVINNGPLAPVPNENPGPWSVFSSPQNPQGIFSEAPNDYIGPRSGTMAPGTSDGVQVSVPDGSADTIREAKLWWTVPQEISGATTFAEIGAWDGSGTQIDEYATPHEQLSTSANFLLPSQTTVLTLADYCANDDNAQGCTFGSGVNPNLQLYGAQLTLADGALPNANVTGGTLTSASTLSGNQTLAYSATDSNSGVRLVKLLIDGQQVAENDYLAQCPYEDFLACPASISDTISWDAATVPDGQHAVEAIVEDAAQNTSVFYDTTITTHNAPANATAPAVNAAAQPTVGGTLSAQPGNWTAPAAAGAITYTYQWQDCDTDGNNCQAIPAAQNATYTPPAGDAGHTLRVLVNAANNDGTSSATSLATSTIPSPPTLTTGGPGSSINGQLNQAPSTTATGTPNGTPATETASLHIEGPLQLHRSFARRAIRITGRLTNNQSQPIAGASLDVLQQTAGTNALTLIRHTTTSPTGTFTVAIPAGPSRLIEIAYRAYSNTTSYTATAQVRETVQAGVSLAISPRTTNPTGKIELRGRVQGPIPPGGTLVVVLVHYRGYWAPIRFPRTKPNGSFEVAYQFQDATGRFPFRVEIPNGQTNFPYTGGTGSVRLTVDVLGWFI